MKKRGVTLIELTIMIAVAAFLFTGMGRAVQNLMQRSVDNRNYLVALQLAKWQMAKMNHGAYPAVGTTNPASDAAFPNFAFTQVVSNVATNGANSLRQIQLDVAVGSRVYVRLYTYRSDIVSFGDGL